MLENPLYAPNCEHAFCEECISEWLNQHQNCPLGKCHTNVTLTQRWHSPFMTANFRSSTSAFTRYETNSKNYEKSSWKTAVRIIPNENFSKKYFFSIFTVFQCQMRKRWTRLHRNCPIRQSGWTFSPMRIQSKATHPMWILRNGDTKKSNKKS